MKRKQVAVALLLALPLVVAAQSAPNVFAPMLRRLASDDKAVIRTAKEEVLSARAELLAGLIGIISDEDNLRRREPSVRAACELLGTLRWPEAVAPLVAIVGYPFGGPDHGDGGVMDTTQSLMWFSDLSLSKIRDKNDW